MMDVRQLISEEDVFCPTSMCVDDRGRLYVVQGREVEVWVIETTDTQATPGDKIPMQQTSMKLSVTWCN